MKILVLTTAYPSEENYYNNGFIHTRLKGYKKINKNLEIEVMVVTHDKKLSHYVYESIDVYKGNIKELKKIYSGKKYDKFLVHFLDHKIIKFINLIGLNEKIFVWVHGAEALSWKRRKFNNMNKNFIKYVFSNIYQIAALRKSIKSNKNYHFIFVSKWMKETMENDSKIKVDNYEIIPNVIDTEFYSYVRKSVNLRKNILLIRPFTSRKYATDIAAKAIYKLSKEFDNFNDLNFTIIGEGPLFDEDTKNIKEFSNVKLINKFLSANEIREHHIKNGVLLLPTRQDSQGVSMCEAMSSGLVPITSNNTAIPEFVSEQEGFLTNSLDDIKNAIIKIYSDEQLFLEMSENSSLRINSLCNYQNTIFKEFNLITKG